MSSESFIPSTDFQNNPEVGQLPIFNVERVQLQFPRPSDFVAAQVANNAIILAFSTGRILRIDLEDAGEIEDIDLPKKPNEVGTIRHLFLDPTASHLLITTSLGDNYYLHSQSKTPKHLSRLKGVGIQCVAWNPSQPTASTREILIGATDGNVYETYIEPSPEFYRREEKYLKLVYKTTEGPITGISVNQATNKEDFRKVLISTSTSLKFWFGKVGQVAHEGSASIYSQFFENETWILCQTSPTTTSVLTISPESEIPDSQHFAWLSSQGVYHGPLSGSPDQTLGENLVEKSKMLPRSHIVSRRPKLSQESAVSMILTEWHILQLVEGRIVAVNLLDHSIVMDQLVLEPGQSALGLFADVKKNTFWLLTAEELFEIRAHEESRDIWRVLLLNQQFDAASQFAKTPNQKDAVATASGDYLLKKEKYLEAAAVYGRSTKPFEQVALEFLEKNEHDALRSYLLTKLSTLQKRAIMQRIMISTWLVELFMAKLNVLDDTITTKAELAEGTNTAETETQLSTTRKEFQDFVSHYKSDLDVKTTYEVISNHGREEELLFFATIADDYNFVLNYWVQRDRWSESLTVLSKQTDPDIFYKYSSVLMANSPIQLVDILMRQSNLEPNRLIPALLNYNKTMAQNPPPQTNQAIRYLNFVINTLGSIDPSIHNTLISMLAASPSTDESALLAYLKTQSFLSKPSYDADFALRLCIQHDRVHSCVHIYTSMSQFARAVDLALKHNAVDLASQVADQSTGDSSLRKRLWLKIAKVVITNSFGSVKTAIDFLKRCELLRIEDLIPFFPDFVIIDDFKDEICQALEEYSRSIDALKRDMDEAALTAANIKSEIKSLDQRYAIVEPGERCWICRLPLLVRQFFVFPCQHGFHSDCLGKAVIELGGVAKGRKIRDLQSEVQKSQGRVREEKVKELDGVIAGGCVLCSDMAVKQIDEPFISLQDNLEEWAL